MRDLAGSHSINLYVSPSADTQPSKENQFLSKRVTTSA